jgi:hypothetical protein
MLNASQLDAFCTDQGRRTLKSAWFIVPGGKEKKKPTQNTIRTEKKETQVGVSWLFLHPITYNSHVHSVNSNYEPRI